MVLPSSICALYLYIADCYCNILNSRVIMLKFVIFMVNGGKPSSVIGAEYRGFKLLLC